MIILIMGVTGAGKTAVGGALARKLGWEFADADTYHSESNVAKMARGEALTDEDREPWLAKLREAITTWICEKRNVILACSALKERYRRQLAAGDDLKVVFLQASPGLIEQRVARRSDHFMPVDLVKSQFDALEAPVDAVAVDAELPVDDIVKEIMGRLGL